MKNFILFICTMFLLSFTTVNQNVEDILTSSKWYVESTQEKGEEPVKADDKNDEWIIFYADGKLEESHFGETSNGNWKYDANDKVIKKTAADDIEFLRLIEVSSEKLVIELVGIDEEDGLMITYVK